MKNKKVILKALTIVAAVIACVFVLMADSCASTDPSADGGQQQQTQLNNSASDRLHKAEPYPVLVDSQELHNQREWYLRLNDPNKVAYIYLMNNDGTVAFEYQIIAKCSSTNSQYSSPDKTDVQTAGSTGVAEVTLPQAQPDGSYGQNEQAVFCFLNDAGRHMIEFSETWHWTWSEVPLGLHSTPQTVVVIPNGK